MKFKLVPIQNPQDRKAEPKYYAKPTYNGMVDVDFIARQIAGRSSLTAGDIKNVLSNFLDEVPTYLLLGYSVKLNDFGTFRLNFSSDGATTPDKFRTSMMNGLKVIYTPDAALKKHIADSVSYEQERHPASDKPGDGGETNPDENPDIL